MRGFYLRWGGLVLAGLWIAATGAQYYYRDVRPLTPEQVVSNHPAGSVRMLGMVEAGSLVKTAKPSHVLFSLIGNGQRMPVVYEGKDPDNLRELKTVVVVGMWDDASRRFLAREIDLVPNYGFITAAYLVMVPMALFLFLMERRVRLLYNEIKLSKVYESEVGELE
ncbi:MAG TPA: cytochrome c maturation protein CcmE [Nitrospiria bacterium]